MEHFKIQDAITHYSLDLEEVAKVLFPKAKHYRRAFDRLLKENIALDTEQMANLASYIGVSIHDLFFTNAWKGASEQGALTLTKGDYKVKISYGGAVFSLFKGAELIEKNIMYAPHISVHDFINHINSIIKQYEEK